jgi:hypothetical protein
MSPWFFGQKRLQRVLVAGIPPLQRFPEKVKVDERFAAQWRILARSGGTMKDYFHVGGRRSLTKIGQDEPT